MTTADAPIGKAEEKELSDLRDKVSGHDEAEGYVNDVLKAVSGYSGMHNCNAIMSGYVADTVKKAEEHKTEGNRSFSAGAFEAALAHYKNAADLFKEYSPTRLDSDAKSMLVVVYSNSAQAYLKLGTDKEASDCARVMADKALALEPSNIKARFRRGCAYANVEDWTKARDDFEYVLRLEPGNESAKRELRSALKHLKKERDVASAGGSGSWEQKAAAGVKSRQCEDPRVAERDQSIAAAILDKKITMASQLRAGALKYWESKGCLDEWRGKMDEMQCKADTLAQNMVEQVTKMEEDGRDLEDVLGPQGAELSKLEKVQWRPYFEADAYITTLKQECAPDFVEIVSVASETSPHPLRP